jgi:hypothetical protein
MHHDGNAFAPKMSSAIRSLVANKDLRTIADRNEGILFDDLHVDQHRRRLRMTRGLRLRILCGERVCCHRAPAQRLT